MTQPSLDFNAPNSLDATLSGFRLTRLEVFNWGTFDKRVAPDFLVGAHVLRQTDVLLTTDADFFRDYFGGLTVVTLRGLTALNPHKL